MNVKEHYDEHLGTFYSWMTGDFQTRQREFESFLSKNGVKPLSTGIAIDQGAGHGIQSVSLARLGFNVTAIDFNKQLLEELAINAGGLDVDIVEDDIRSLKKYAYLNPEVIVCWGDTLTHLDSMQEIEQLLTEACRMLPQRGKLIVSFRDYSVELTNESRFIPVRSDDQRILTAFIEYHEHYVTVTDLLHEKAENGWQQKLSSYRKVRIPISLVWDILTANGMEIIFNQSDNRLVSIIASKVNLS
jgi:ubiquinone/menaquinone biosynthesis C-methylase UbiE